MDSQLERIRTTCPRDCYDGCGIVVERRDGAITRVLGDPDHPVSRGALCGKCATAYNGVWQDEQARLLYPLKRTGPKGHGQFERVGWDEALTTIASKLQNIVQTTGPEAIIHTHYTGTLSLLAYMFPLRFFHRLGATEVEPDTICNMAGHVAWGLLFGSSYVGFDPRTAADSRCILVWGANPAHSAPHAHKHWLPESPAQKVVVDPIRTETAAQADLHLQPFPGTDAALAFSLLHVLHRDGFFQPDFIANHTMGYDEVLPLLAPCTPAWGEQTTGVPADLIERAAHLYGPGPSLLWVGQGLQRQTTGGNVMRACGLLPALTGNIGKPGAGFYYLNITPGIAGMDFDALAGNSLAKGRVPHISHMDFTARLEDASVSQALVCWNTNPAASAPQQQRLHAALKREDLFTVAIDCFPTDTTDFADIVLPAASFLEFDDLTFSYFHLNIGAQSKAREPMGESLPNQEIFRRLATAMGFEESALFEPDEAIISQMLAEMQTGCDFSTLQQTGWRSISQAPLVFYEDLTFDTPSGKIEIASDKAEQKGLPRVPQPWADTQPTNNRFRLLSPASRWRLNDSYANDTNIQQRAGQAGVTLHPDDAAQLGVTNGTRVRLANETGQLELTATIDAIAPRGVALAHKGRWPKLEADRHNVNTLNPGIRSDMGESSSVHSTEVTIRPC